MHKPLGLMPALHKLVKDWDCYMRTIPILGKAKQEDQVFQPGAREMAQEFRAIIVFPDFLGSIPRIHMVVTTISDFFSRDSMSSLDL